jgi:hypothetical protein
MFWTNLKGKIHFKKQINELNIEYLTNSNGFILLLENSENKILYDWKNDENKFKYENITYYNLEIFIVSELEKDDPNLDLIITNLTSHKLNSNEKKIYQITISMKNTKDSNCYYTAKKILNNWELAKGTSTIFKINDSYNKVLLDILKIVNYKFEKAYLSSISLEVENEEINFQLK